MAGAVRNTIVGWDVSNQVMNRINPVTDFKWWNTCNLTPDGEI
jgi:hypothetical protein